MKSIRLCAAIAAAFISHGTPAISLAQQPAFKIQIVADEMCCKGCAQKVAAQLYAAPGVTLVETDVPNHLVTISAKPSPKLTLERLWNAVEQGKGSPSKLLTPQATYVLTRAEDLKPEQRLSANRYTITVESLDDNEGAQRIANQLYSIPGVQNVSVAMPERRLFVETTGESPLSPWALASAAEQAQGEPIAVAGPYGILSIERSATATAVKQHYSETRGGVR